MPTAPKRPCAEHGCPRLVARGEGSRCEQHRQQREPWQRSSSAPRRQPGGNGWAWQRTRKRILERDGYQCRYCGAAATEVDHVIPRAQGGSDDDDNLVSACAGCNEAKRRREAADGRARRG